MGTSELRRRLLLAMGLPAIGCGGTQREEPPPPPPWHGGGGETTGGGGGDGIANEEPPYRPGDPCGLDQVPEMICGAVSGSGAKTCGPTGDALTSYGQSSLYVTQGSYGAHDATFASFYLDADATARYQASIRAQQPQLPLDEYCCYSTCSPLRVATSAQVHVPAGFHTERACIPPPPAGTRAPAAADAACPAAVELAGTLAPHDGSPSHGQCCYDVVVADPPVEERRYRGRPARIDGEARVTPVAPVAGWTAPVAIAALPAEVRARLAAAWTTTAQMEHASIAAFSHLSLRLIAAGAPPELLAATHRAALDEIEHARVAFALASAYAGAPVGPAPFAEVGALRASDDLAALARETFVDGCVGETVAACEARRAAAACEDRGLAATLATVAEDETRHAELAWAVVAWCVRREPALLDELEAALSDDPTAATIADDVDLSAHGVLPSRELARLRREVIATVVAPCLAELRRQAAGAQR